MTAWQAVQRALNWSKDIDPATLDEGLLEAERAVAIDPDYGMAHAVLAYVCMCVSFFWGGNQRERARVHLDKALKLSPNDAPKLTWAAETARRLGDPAKALQLAKRALRSSPGAFAANAMAGSALNDLGRHEEALAHLDTELRVAPDNQANHYAHLWRAAAFHGLGRRDDMLAALDAALEFNPQFDLLLVRRAVEYVRDGEPDQAQACLGRLRASFRALGPGIYLARLPEGLRLGVEQTATLENLWPTAERDGV